MTLVSPAATEALADVFVTTDPQRDADYGTLKDQDAGLLDRTRVNVSRVSGASRDHGKRQHVPSGPHTRRVANEDRQASGKPQRRNFGKNTTYILCLLQGGLRSKLPGRAAGS